MQASSLFIYIQWQLAHFFGLPYVCMHSVYSETVFHEAGRVNEWLPNAYENKVKHKVTLYRLIFYFKPDMT